MYFGVKYQKQRKLHFDGVICLSPAVYLNQPFHNPCITFNEWMCFFIKVNCFPYEVGCLLVCSLICFSQGMYIYMAFLKF
uniref:Uncharacterized protein n=1 Tax=Populus trichocarpa TaxID=3694 RepID=A0A2K1Y046_POPTR